MSAVITTQLAEEAVKHLPIGKFIRNATIATMITTVLTNAITEHGTDLFKGILNAVTWPFRKGYELIAGRKERAAEAEKVDEVADLRSQVHNLANDLAELRQAQAKVGEPKFAGRPQAPNTNAYRPFPGGGNMRI